MFALLAAIAFALAAFDADFPIDLLYVGLFFVALHLLVGIWPFGSVLPPRSRN